MPENNTAPCSAPCLIATALNTVEVQQRELEQLAPGNVRVKTEYSMVSTGTELHTIQGTHTQDRPFPRMTGYIAQGHVVGVGEDAGGLALGDRHDEPAQGRLGLKAPLARVLRALRQKRARRPRRQGDRVRRRQTLARWTPRRP